MSVGAVAVIKPLNVVSGFVKFVVDQTRYVRPETLDQLNRFNEVMLAIGIHAGFKSKTPEVLLAELSLPALLTAVTVA